MEDYKANSQKAREEAKANHKKIEKVINGEVTVKKETATKRLIREMLSEDLANVLIYIKDDVLIPALKAAISGGVDMLVYGESKRQNYRNNNSNRTSYTSYYAKDSRNRTDTHTVSYSRKDRYNFNEIIFESYAEADAVLANMIDIIREYDVVSVADLYELVGMPSSYTDHKYGWERDMLDDSKPYRVGNREYALKLPRAIPID